MGDAFGSWTLESLIAVGGLGEVWRAHRGDATCALKRLHTHLARNDEGRSTFAVEQKLVTTLPHHPNVVHGDEAGDVGGLPYVAMELLHGDDVRRILAPPPTKSDVKPTAVTIARERALAIVLAACDGATHLHANGYVHGDINPGNLVLADRIVLVDLGVARPIGQAGAVRGTHAYMAPEQVKGAAWTPATDVFALGVVLWELVAGARLFHRGPMWLSMSAVVEADVPALPDAALDRIAQAALAKDPAARTQTAAELAAQLRS
ncbi:MAG TPA: serine/threonine-protein kinase [Polyangiaceae bacterium]